MAFVLVSVAEDAGFEPARAVNPTRFPSERHRPLGESSAPEDTRNARRGRNRPGCPPGSFGRAAVSYTRRRFPVRRYLAELPQGRKAARVSELFRVRGEPSFSPDHQPLVVPSSVT